MTGRPLQPIPHGTARGATAHRRRGERPCEECRVAQAADSKERKAGRRRAGATRARIDDPRKPGQARPSWGWQDAAACRGEDLVLFFGPDGERTADREARERHAKQVCMGCPVRAECLDYAVTRPEKYGTWGGLNEDERASERRRRVRRAS